MRAYNSRLSAVSVDQRARWSMMTVLCAISRIAVPIGLIFSHLREYFLAFSWSSRLNIPTPTVYTVKNASVAVRKRSSLLQTVNDSFLRGRCCEFALDGISKLKGSLRCNFIITMFRL